MKHVDPATRARRAAWQNRGDARPAFALEPGPGQESVWDYPRPPKLEREARPVEIRAGHRVVARSSEALRVLETASPPTVYVPPTAITGGRLVQAGGASHCEWKGRATYWDLVLDDATIEQAAWSYAAPYREFEPLRDWLCFYPDRVACRLGGEEVRPQPSAFYGGWITPDIVGPFKGEPGTEGW